jgi:hypothetical protein
MKKKQFESICRKIIPDLPGFACKGWLLYAHPTSHILRGFCCDGSGFDPSRFVVWVFALPLYVPRKHVSFNFGNRLNNEKGCEKWWDIQEPDLANKLLNCIQQQGLPFLDGVRQPSQIVTLAEQRPGKAFPPSLEAVAYSLVMADDYAGAQSAFDRLVKAIDLNYAWQAEILERANQFRQKLNSDPQGAKQLLAEWEQESVKNLGL